MESRSDEARLSAWALLSMRHYQMRFTLHGPRISARVSNLAVETRFWPRYEVVDGRCRLSYRPKVYVPIEEWLRPQGCFKHLFEPEHRDEVAAIQRQVDAD